jgi:hypothetical protein
MFVELLFAERIAGLPFAPIQCAGAHGTGSIRTEQSRSRYPLGLVESYL